MTKLKIRPHNRPACDRAGCSGRGPLSNRTTSLEGDLGCAIASAAKTRRTSEGTDADLALDGRSLIPCLTFNSSLAPGGWRSE